jgi:hypothetical protein
MEVPAGPWDTDYSCDHEGMAGAMNQLDGGGHASNPTLDCISLPALQTKADPTVAIPKTPQATFRHIKSFMGLTSARQIFAGAAPRWDALGRMCASFDPVFAWSQSCR